MDFNQIASRLEADRDFGVCGAARLGRRETGLAGSWSAARSAAAAASCFKMDFDGAEAFTSAALDPSFGDIGTIPPLFGRVEAQESAPSITTFVIVSECFCHVKLETWQQSLLQNVVTSVLRLIKVASSLVLKAKISYVSVMTEITETIDTMPEAVRRFILHWGDMGQQWGVNRSIAQIHALLYITEALLPADAISETLGIARSNVSNSLKELLGFGIVRRVPVSGDRRDHFTAETDVWELARRIAAVRKTREIDPALETLTHCLSEANGDVRLSDVQRKRLQEMHAFTADMDRWYTQMQALPVRTLTRLVRLGDRIVALLGLAQKST